MTQVNRVGNVRSMIKYIFVVANVYQINQSWEHNGTYSLDSLYTVRNFGSFVKYTDGGKAAGEIARMSEHGTCH
jgi:hypothetical protein